MPEIEEIPNDSVEEIVDPVVDKEEHPSPKMVPAIPHKVADDEDEDDDEDIDETLAERFMALTEMFPESLRNVTCGLAYFSVGASKWLYSVGRVGMWVAASSATMLALPVMFEMERSQMEEQQLAQQRQILLGPNAAVAGGMAPGMMPPPPQR